MRFSRLTPVMAASRRSGLLVWSDVSHNDPPGLVEQKCDTDRVSRVPNCAEANVLPQPDHFATPNNLVVTCVLPHRDVRLVSGVPESRSPSTRPVEVRAAHTGLGIVIGRRQPPQRAIEKFRVVEVAGVFLNPVV